LAGLQTPSGLVSAAVPPHRISYAKIQKLADVLLLGQPLSHLEVGTAVPVLAAAVRQNLDLDVDLT